MAPPLTAAQAGIAEDYGSTLLIQGLSRRVDREARLRFLRPLSLRKSVFEATT